MDGKNNQATARPCRALWDSPYRELTDLAIRIGHMHRTALERRLNRTGVYRSQHQLLMCIAKYPQMSQKQLAKERHVSTATVAVSLKKLENGGYIRRTVDQGDNRYNRICITEKGQAVVDKSICCFQDIERQIYRGFSREELDSLLGYLARIGQNIENLLKEKGEEDRQ